MIRLIASVFAFALCLGLEQTVFAHAVLMGSNPKANEMLATAPNDLTLTFNENVGPIFFKVLDRTGKEVGNAGEIKLDGYSLILPLGDTLPNGTYVLTYRVISADTHPVGATFGFSVGEPMADMSQMQTAAPTTTAWTAAVAANRWVLYVTMLLTAGSALFILLMMPPAGVAASTSSLGRKAALVATVAYLLAVGLGGAEMMLAGGNALFSAETWVRGLKSTLSPSAAIGVPAMLVLLYAFGGPAEKPRTGALVVGAIGAVASFLVTGHAATAPPVWLMATTVAVHLFCTAFWLGALYPLYKTTQLADAVSAGRTMTKFSVWAMYSVGLIVVSGVVITWTQVQTPANLFGTDYGTILVRKLVAVALILALAAYNKFVLTPQLERGDQAGARRIRNTIRIEFALYLFILGAAMALTTVSPPRAIVSGAAPTAGMMGDGFKTTAQAAGYSADIEVTPARAGENMMMITIKDKAGAPVTTLADLEVTANLPAAGISDVMVKGQNIGNGMWHVVFKEMIIPGDWTIRVDAFVTDFDKVGLAATIPIK